jgi:allophanate hydrolase subunit 2
VDLGSRFLRPLQKGDGLEVAPFDPDRARCDPLAAAPRASTVRVILGPQDHHFDEPAIAMLLNASWRAGLDSDRVGARLDGPRLTHAGPAEIVSDGMVPGCIQVPPDGRPIVMLSDCPTTGGYPKIACVVSDDLGLIAQAVPGETAIRFVAVRMEEL